MFNLAGLVVALALLAPVRSVHAGSFCEKATLSFAQALGRTRLRRDRLVQAKYRREDARSAYNWVALQAFWSELDDQIRVWHLVKSALLARASDLNLRRSLEKIGIYTSVLEPSAVAREELWIGQLLDIERMRMQTLLNQHLSPGDRDDVWFFQTDRPLKLFTRDGADRLIIFERGDWVILKQWTVIARRYDRDKNIEFFESAR